MSMAMYDAPLKPMRSEPALSQARGQRDFCSNSSIWLYCMTTWCRLHLPQTPGVKIHVRSNPQMFSTKCNVTPSFPAPADLVLHFTPYGLACKIKTRKYGSHASVSFFISLNSDVGFSFEERKGASGYSDRNRGDREFSIVKLWLELLPLPENILPFSTWMWARTRLDYGYYPQRKQHIQEPRRVKTRNFISLLT